MSWIINNGLLIHGHNGAVLYPWEYSLQWDIANKVVNVVGNDNAVITSCYDDETSYQQLTDWQKQGECWQGLELEIDSEILPGDSKYRLNQAELTNGVVCLKLAKCKLTDIDDEHFGLTCNGVRYLVKNEGEVKQHLTKLINVFTSILDGVSPVSQMGDAPGSSDFLRAIAWIYCILSIGAGLYFGSKLDAVGIGFGVAAGGVILLSFALVMSNINDSLHKLLISKK